MKEQFSHIRALGKRLVIVLALFSLCRILFYAFNADLFTNLNVWRFLRILLAGLRFDIAAIIYINFIFILLHIVPNPWRDKKWYQGILKGLFYTFNSIALFLEVSDFIYYRYTQVRTSSHVLGLAQDFVQLIPQFLKDFWFVPIAVAVAVLLLERVYKRTHTPIFKNSPINYTLQGAMAMVVLGLSVIGARGGMQSEPITPLTATKYTHINNVPLVYNTTFKVLYTLSHPKLNEMEFFSHEEANQIFPVYHPPDAEGYFSFSDAIKPASKPNMVIFLMESFSKEYIGYYNDYDGYTPFLDSLMSQSITFTNAYANGKHSIDAVPSISMGLPALMNDAYISSRYATNKMEGLGDLLSAQGYHTYFFHGGSNHTMGFHEFTDASGFDGYYGRDEYNNEEDFDGTWGIYDEPFFQFTSDQLDKLPQPFCVIIFSLSSHHPFSVPDKYKGKFKKGPLPIHETIGYCDYALHQFFDHSASKSWYDSTVFFITADHTGQVKEPLYNNKVGQFAIPLTIFIPNKSIAQKRNYVVSQADIHPTLLELAGYNRPYMSFGNNLLNSSGFKYSICRSSEVFQLIHDDYVLHFGEDKPLSLYNYKEDPLLENNLLNHNFAMEAYMERKLKAIVQQYNHILIHNEMCPS